MPNTSSNQQPTPQRVKRSYIAPELIRVHLDPVRELLQDTQCNPAPGNCVEPTCA
jgi:hypothetical protein